MIWQSRPKDSKQEPGARGHTPDFNFMKNARRRFFVEHDTLGALGMIRSIQAQKKKLGPAETRAFLDLNGSVLMANRQYAEAGKIFGEQNDFYMAGYCYLLLGKLDGVHYWWNRLQAVRENHWAFTLYGLATRQLQSWPTFLQIRNHIESDVAYLVQANQLQMLDNLLSYTDFLAQLNPESYKLIGRALFHSGLRQQAGPLLMRGQKVYPQDPEVYYHLAQFHCANEDFAVARLMLNQALLINPHYVPARDLLQRALAALQAMPATDDVG